MAERRPTGGRGPAGASSLVGTAGKLVLLVVAIGAWLVGASPVAAAPAPVRVCAEDRGWLRPSQEEMARTVWRDNRYREPDGRPIAQALAYHRAHFVVFSIVTGSGVAHALDMTGLMPTRPHGFCEAQTDAGLRAGRTLVVWVLGYHPTAADLVGPAVAVTAEPNATPARGYAAVEVPRPGTGTWTIRFVLPDGREVASTAGTHGSVVLADEAPADLRAAQLREALTAFMDARMARRQLEALDLMSDGARQLAGTSAALELVPASNPCWYRYAVEALDLPTPSTAEATVRVFEHQWMGDVGGFPPRSWPQKVGLVRTPAGWRVDRLDTPGPRREEPGEPHGPTTSACNVGRRPAVWLAAVLPATGGPPGGALLLAATLELALVGAGVVLRRRTSSPSSIAFPPAPAPPRWPGWRSDLG